MKNILDYNKFRVELQLLKKQNFSSAYRRSLLWISPGGCSHFKCREDIYGRLSMPAHGPDPVSLDQSYSKLGACNTRLCKG